MSLVLVISVLCALCTSRFCPSPGVLIGESCFGFIGPSEGYPSGWLLIDHEEGWEAADRYCSAQWLGNGLGHLASIRTRDEFDRIMLRISLDEDGWVGSESRVFIGLRMHKKKFEPTGVCLPKWIDGSDSTDLPFNVSYDETDSCVGEFNSESVGCFRLGLDGIASVGECSAESTDDEDLPFICRREKNRLALLDYGLGTVVPVMFVAVVISCFVVSLGMVCVTFLFSRLCPEKCDGCLIHYSRPTIENESLMERVCWHGTALVSVTCTCCCCLVFCLMVVFIWLILGLQGANTYFLVLGVLFTIPLVVCILCVPCCCCCAIAGLRDDTSQVFSGLFDEVCCPNIEPGSEEDDLNSMTFCPPGRVCHFVFCAGPTMLDPAVWEYCISRRERDLFDRQSRRRDDDDVEVESHVDLARRVDATDTVADGEIVDVEEEGESASDLNWEEEEEEGEEGEWASDFDSKEEGGGEEEEEGGEEPQEGQVRAELPGLECFVPGSVMDVVHQIATPTEMEMPGPPLFGD